MSLNTSTFNVTFNAGETSTVGLISDPHAVFQQFALTLADGTGASKAQKLATQALTVSNVGTTIDLTACAGGLGNANIAFTKIKALMILNNDAAINLVVGNAASNQWTGLVSAVTTTITIGPGGCLVVFRPDATGMAVSGGSKSLLLAAASSSISVSLLIVGEGS